MKYSLFVLVVIGSLLLAACGGGGAPAATQAPATSQPAGANAPVQITYMEWGDPA